jgi:hypothetical protein
MADNNDWWLVTHRVTAERITPKEGWGLPEIIGAIIGVPLGIFIAVAIIGALVGQSPCP